MTGFVCQIEARGNPLIVAENSHFLKWVLLSTFYVQLYTSSMRILGVDPGLTRTGLGLIEVPKVGEPRAVEWLTIETPAGLPLAERLRELAADLKQYLRETKPDLAVVEKLFFATNKRTAMDVSQARGVIVAALSEAGIAVVEATPMQLKTTVTGDGRADKKQVQSMVKRILKLKEIPTPADAADGLALALYGAFTQKFSSPSHHRRSTLQQSPPSKSHVSSS